MNSKGKCCVEPGASNIQKQSAVQRRKHWVPPLQGTFKINVDVAFNQLSRDAAVGVMIRELPGVFYLIAGMQKRPKL
jgi:hypothetical protein